MCIFVFSVNVYQLMYIICELVRLYLLDQLSTVIDKSSVDLYRDDGLAAINNANGPKYDRISKDIIA